MAVVAVIVMSSLVTCIACEFVLMDLGNKAGDLCRERGGDPPRYSIWCGPWSFALGPGPDFWDYVRQQCRKGGAERLREMMKRAERLLVIRAIGLLAALCGFAALGLLAYLDRAR
jgi:hypothetical protein